MGKSLESFLPMIHPLMPTCATSRCTTSASQPFFPDWSILMYTSTILDEASGKDLRRQRERQQLAVTQRWSTCLSTVCRQLPRSPRLLPNAKPRHNDVGWIG